MSSSSLRTRYIAALAAVALLSITGQFLVQAILTTQENDSAVINLAGRQRMLSQRIVKTALIAVQPMAVSSSDERWRARLNGLVSEWQTAHRGLRDGDPGIGSSEANSADVQAAFAELDDSFQRMNQAVGALVERTGSDREAIARLLVAEREFLRGMEEIVSLYERESAARVRFIQRVELGLLGLVLLTLLLEGLLVFRPAERRIRETLDRLRADIRARRRLERELLQVAERERTRIGQDLHDGLCQHLAGLTMFAKTLRKRVEQGKVDNAAVLLPDLTTLGDLLQSGLESARQMSRGLFPEMLVERGLAAALREVCSTANTLHKVACECEVELGDLQLEQNIAVQLYRIVQEAIANAVRHADADRVLVSLTREGEHVQLKVADNGIGLGKDGAELTPDLVSESSQGGQLNEVSGGIGLRSMAMRAHTIGAEFALKENQPRGTAVCCRLPLAR